MDPKRLVQWAEARFEDEQSPWNWHLLGLAHYRAGNFEQAIEYLETSNAAGWDEMVGPVINAQNWLVLSMCHRRLGHPQQATDCLETAQKLIQDATPDSGGRVALPVPDWVEIHVFATRI